MTVKTVYSAEKTAEMVGISKATLRYYEEYKIIGPISRDVHNYREYTAEDIEWIKVIVLLEKTDNLLAQKITYLETHKL